MGAILRLEAVGVREGAAAESLSDIDIALGRGDLLAAIGTSGAGKSRLVAVSAGACRPSRGRVRLFGTDPYLASPGDRATLRRRIGWAGAALPLVARLTVRENVALPLAIAGTAGDEADERVRELLGWLRLDARARALPQTLSRGERARTTLARALAGRPELLIVDDLADCGDAGRAAALIEGLRAFGAAVLVTARDEREVRALGEGRRIHLANGRAIAAATPALRA